MNTKPATRPLDLGLVAGDRPVPVPSSRLVPPGPASERQSPGRIEPVLDLGAPATPNAAVPQGAFLDLAPQPVPTGTAPTFGAVRATAHGVLGRARALAAVANGVRTRIPWRALRTRATATMAPTVEAAAQPGDTLTAPAPRARRPKKTWREQRWERRRRRRMVEEVLGWIFVPIIVIAVAWGVKAGLNAFGTTPTGLITNLKAALSGRGG